MRGGLPDEFFEFLAEKVCDLLVAHLDTPEFEAELTEIVHSHTESHTFVKETLRTAYLIKLHMMYRHMLLIFAPRTKRSHTSLKLHPRPQRHRFPSGHPAEVFKTLGFHEENVNS